MPDVDAVDLVVVGSGPSGAVLTMRAAQAGLSVVCLEQGEWQDRSQLLSGQPEAELGWLERFNPDPNVRLAPTDYPIVNGGADIMPVMANGVGGSMLQWAGMWHPLLPSDFRVRTLDGVAEDWPIDFNHLAPYYERATTEMGVSGLGGDPAHPELAPPPNPPLPIGLNGYAVARGLTKLGWHWWPGSNALASRKYRHLEPCQLRGVCILGCPENAKAMPGNVYWPLAKEAGARLITQARVSQVELDEHGRACGVVYFDGDGTERRVRAGAVVLAANAVGTARILLMSTSARFPDGLANRSGLVGRNLMQHPYATIAASFPDRLDAWKGPFGEGIYSLEFAETDPANGFVRGTKWMTSPGQGPFAAYQEATAGVPVRELRTHELVDTIFDRSVVLGIQCDDLPEEHNLVDLDPQVTDGHGLPAPRVVYKLSENSRRMIEFNLARAEEALLASGATRISTIELWPTGIGHVLGTARMGTNPETSVVGVDGQAHDVPNLYVVDTSVFVTGGAMNPGATTIALAHHFADRMLAERGRQ